MSIIKSHNIILQGGNDEYRIKLLPLSDEHIPLLCKWNTDPEVMYFTDGGYIPKDVSSYVQRKYGGMSQNNLCFAVEVNGEVVGECWLQKMNVPAVIEMYPEGADIRRIDMSIGEKAYWGKGIGTMFIGMLIKYAFECEHVDVMHCFCEDYNIRSRRVWEKNGFKLVFTEELSESSIGKFEYHWRLTRDEYTNKF